MKYLLHGNTSLLFLYYSALIIKKNKKDLLQLISKVNN
jgi:hypothetical protein